MRLRHDIPHLPLALALAFFAVLLGGCSSLPKAPSTSKNTPSVAPAPAPVAYSRTPGSAPALPAAGSGRGGYYQDDGPGDKTPEGLLSIPDAEPKIEPLLGKGNKPYVVFGKTYTPIADNRPFKQRGVGSWYGKKFHGQKTSSGELYDMYKMTAAHPTLPLPSYVRVTNLSNGAQVIVRVNDRGPFHSSRIIDLSYTAAYKLGYLGKGSSELEIERILPDEIERMGRYKANPAASPMQTIQLTDSKAGPHPLAVALELPTTQAGDVEKPEVYAVAPPMTVTSVPEVSAPTPLTVTAPVIVPIGGFYLQFGAYALSDNADAASNRLQPNWIAALPPLKVVESGALYRLYSGPFANREDAVNAAQRAQDAGLPKPLVVQR